MYQDNNYSSENVDQLIAKAETGLLEHTFLGRFIILVLLGAVYAIVYFTGGTQYAYLHLIYIPLLIAALSFGPIEVLIISIVAGLIMGPIMPLNVASAIPQKTGGWIMRVGFFIFTGQILSYFIQKRNAIKQQLISANKEISEINESLEEKVSARTEELKTMVVDLENANQNRHDLLHILCHDLKNPLGAIFSTINMIKDFSQISPDEAPTIKNLLQLSSQHGLEIINLVRDFEALDTHKKNLELSKLNLHKAFVEALLIIDKRLKEKNINIHLEISPDISVIAEETSLVYSVLTNILTNAIKFSFRNSEIKVKAIIEKDVVILTVTDKGIGMSKELQAKVFEVYEKTTRNGTEGEEGTGFGMPLMKKFIETYGGKLAIDSTSQDDDAENHGTTITVTFKSC